MAIFDLPINKKLFREYAKRFTFISTPSEMFISLTTQIPEDQVCQRCKGIYFHNKCPHCGNTFLKRDILRQTS